MEEFLKRCFYHSGQYDSQENFAALDKKLKEHEVIGLLPEISDSINIFIFQLIYLLVIDTALVSSWSQYLLPIWFFFQCKCVLVVY